MSEKNVVEQFKKQIESEHLNWKVQTEIPVGDLTADARIVEVEGDRNSPDAIIKDIVAYIEAKSPDANLRELLTGLAQAQYYRENTLRDTWLVLNHDQTLKIFAAKKKSMGGILVYDMEERKLLSYESVEEKMAKSSLKRAQETTLQTWSKEFKVKTISPICITQPILTQDDVNFNVGARIRGMIKEIAKTISGTLAETVKYTIYVEPLDMKICKKKELTLITKFIPTTRGTSSKRELYEVPAGKEITFTVRCISKKLTQELIEDLIRQAGQFTGIGDSHSDGYHGRFDLITT